MSTQTFNLTSESGIDRFLDLYGTRTGRWLANRLNLSGPGSQKFANLLSSYCWNARAMYVCRRKDEMKGVESSATRIYTHACTMIAEEIKAHPIFNPQRWRV